MEEIYRMPYKIRTEEYKKEEEKLGAHAPEKRVEYKKSEARIVQQKPTKISVPILQRLAKDMQSSEFEPLETMGSKVVGSLFDRLRFLKERIEETQAIIKEREAMNLKFNKEIDSDIAEMEKIIQTISNRDELREFKLNVTLLRMEKRKENTLFWRDMVSLRKQLKELKEEFEAESRISQLFSEFDAK